MTKKLTPTLILGMKLTLATFLAATQLNVAQAARYHRKDLGNPPPQKAGEPPKSSGAQDAGTALERPDPEEAPTTRRPSATVPPPQTGPCGEGHPLESFIKIVSNTEPQVTKEGLYYLSDLHEVPQLFFTSAAGKTADQLTTFADGVKYFAVSPDGKKILLATDLGGDEQFDIHLLDVTTKKIRGLLVDRAARVQSVAWAPDSSWFAYTSNKRNQKDFDLYRYDLKDAHQILLAELEGHNDVTDVAPSGLSILLTNSRSNVDSDILLWSLTSKQLTNLTKHSEEQNFGSARFAADSKHFYFVSDFEKGVAQVYVGVVSDLKARRPLSSGKWEVEDLNIDSTRSAIVFLKNEDGYSTVHSFEVTADAQKKRAVIMPSFANKVLNSPQIIKLPSGWTIFYGSSASTQSPQIMSWLHPKEIPWTKSEELVPSACFSAEKLVHYPTFDGRPIPAFLYSPRKASGPTPFIVYVHGGPESQFRPTFNRMFQYFLERGFGVFAPNVRGSIGYGKEYSLLDNYTKRMDSVKDAVEGANWLLKTGNAKPGQLAIYGGSYGGFMVLRSLQVAPELFSAASESVGIANFVTFLKNTKPYRRALREAEYGPLSDEKFLKSISPMTYLDQLKTPLIVFHGANDPRVPVTETEQLVEALKQKSVPVEFKVFPDEGHGNRKLRNILEQAKMMVYFFEKYLKKS